jgi:hypothetical protein
MIQKDEEAKQAPKPLENDLGKVKSMKGLNETLYQRMVAGRSY